ncbi:MAG TPA: zf-HC2 domain-containing protein [Thermoanaerobaculia bacterium]|nr:zf-HC2 domain-containing protein [Thermoanaerobaculia bacterium]
MDQGHPKPEVLALYVRGELGREESRVLEAHLASCVSCQEAVDRLPARSGSVVRWQGHRFAKRDEPAGQDLGRGETVRGVLRALQDVLSAAGQAAAARLLSQPEHRRRALIRQDDRFHTLELCELLEAKCRAAWIDEPEEAVEYARLAALIAQRLSPEAYGAEKVENVRALAWVHLGTSFRLASRDRGSEVAESTEPADPDAYPTGAVGASVLRDGSNRLGNVESALRETRAAFLERGLGHDAALVTLDLVSAYLREDRSGEIGELALEAEGLFSDPYLVDAMRFLRGFAKEGAEEGEVTPEVLERMALLLQRRRDGAPERFE